MLVQYDSFFHNHPPDVKFVIIQLYDDLDDVKVRFEVPLHIEKPHTDEHFVQFFIVVLHHAETFGVGG